MDLRVFEDIFDVPSAAASDIILVRLSMAISEVYKVVYNVYPSKYLVHHVAKVARTGLHVNACDDELVASAIRTLADTVMLADRIGNDTKLAEAIARSTKAVVGLQGRDLEAYLSKKTDAKRRSGSVAAPGDVRIVDEDYVVNPVSGHVVRVLRDAVHGFGVPEARSMAAYTSAMDSRWQRIARCTIAVQTDMSDPAIEFTMRTAQFPGVPDAFVHAGTLYAAVVKASPISIVLHKGPTPVLPHVGLPSRTWTRPTWLPGKRWVPLFLGHVVQTTLTASNDQARGYVAFLDALMERMETRKRREQPRAFHRTNHAIVAVDTRANIMTALSLYIAFLEVRHLGFERVHVVTSSENAQWYADMLSEAGVDAIVRTIPDELSGKTFDTDAYSVLLKRADFWSVFEPDAKVLVVQDDGFLLDGTGFEQFMQYDYVGAPWAKENLPDLVSSLGDNLVGNGGLSLRSASVMQRISSEPTLKDAMFLKNMMVIPEDVFYTLRTRQLGFSVCPWDVAKGFATEQVLPLYGEVTRGLHKPWHYYGAEGVRAVFASLPSL